MCVCVIADFKRGNRAFSNCSRGPSIQKKSRASGLNNLKWSIIYLAFQACFLELEALRSLPHASRGICAEPEEETLLFPLFPSLKGQRASLVAASPEPYVLPQRLLKSPPFSTLGMKIPISHIQGAPWGGNEACGGCRLRYSLVTPP